MKKEHSAENIGEDLRVSLVFDAHEDIPYSYGGVTKFFKCEK